MAALTNLRQFSALCANNDKTNPKKISLPDLEYYVLVWVEFWKYIWPFLVGIVAKYEYDAFLSIWPFLPNVEYDDKAWEWNCESRLVDHQWVRVAAIGYSYNWHPHHSDHHLDHHHHWHSSSLRSFFNSLWLTFCLGDKLKLHERAELRKYLWIQL